MSEALGEDDAMSLRSSTECDEDPDPAEAALIDESYIEGNLTFLSVKCCKTCAHSSTELNPLTRGRYARSRRQPTWPWRYGEPCRPRGLVCRICETAWVLGGFATEHPSMDKMIEDMQRSDSLTEEFAEASKRVVHLINSGRITLRLRGRKKSSVQSSLMDTRAKVVEVIKQEGVAVKVPFKAVKLSVWKTKNQNKDPKEEGFAVKTINVPGEGLVECVMMREAPEGEYAVEFQTSLSALIKEQHDAGNTTIREGQEESKYASLGKAVSGDIKVLAEGKSYDDYQAAQARPCSSRAGRHAECSEEDEGNESAADDAESSCDSDLDSAVCLKGSLLDGLALNCPVPGCQ